ncbi:putative tricarboxylate transport protein, mitochondrial [Drosophila busckii]|nr:putative tricarboxylate transport protein, mitochondrial [Drosophila busckii]
MGLSGVGGGLKGFAAGSITGGVEILITYPTEYVKTNLQLDQMGEHKKYSGVLDCVRKTVKEYGIFGMYRGLSPLIVGGIPKMAVRFGTFEYFSEKFKEEDGSEAHVWRFIAGMIAGITEAIFVVTPMETIKVKFINDLRSSEPRFKGLVHGVTQIIKNEGIGGIYRGATATIIKQGSNQAIRSFVLYSLKDWYTGRDPKATVPHLLVGIFGATAGGTSVCIDNPVDVVKTRMQGLEAAKYKNSLDCFLTTMKEEGPLAFYKGTLPRMTRVCLDVGLTFMIYDTIKDLINKRWT